MASFALKDKGKLFLAAALASRNITEGHICLDLRSVAGNVIFESEDGKSAIECPPLSP